MRITWLAISSLLLVVLGACNQADPPVSDGECIADPDDDRFYPLQPGAWWRHTVTNPNSGVSACPDKVVSVEGLSAIPLRPEVTAFRVVRRSSEDIAVRWQEVRGQDVVRHVDEWFDLNMRRAKIVHYCPFQVRVSGGDVQAFTDTVWQAEVTATTPDHWAECESITFNRDTCVPMTPVDIGACTVRTTESVSEWLRVGEDNGNASAPAGDFSAVRTWSIQEGGEPAVEYSWARGLGKVTETRSGTDRDVLVDCCVPSTGCTRPPPAEADLGCP